jgi:hypothetical protein
MIVRYTTDLVPGMVAKGLERQTTSDTQAHGQGTKKMEKHGYFCRLPFRTPINVQFIVSVDDELSRCTLPPKPPVSMSLPVFIKARSPSNISCVPKKKRKKKQSGISCRLLLGSGCVGV